MKIFYYKKIFLSSIVTLLMTSGLESANQAISIIGLTTGINLYRRDKNKDKKWNNWHKQDSSSNTFYLKLTGDTEYGIAKRTDGELPSTTNSVSHKHQGSEFNGKTIWRLFDNPRRGNEIGDGPETPVIGGFGD